MKKKIVTLCLVVALAATAIIGGTLAYFTDSAYDENLMTAGKLDITQTEEVDKETPMVPVTDEEGMNLDNKVVTITNEGNVPAYVRTLVAFEHTDLNGDGSYSDGIAWKVHAEYNKNLSYTTFGGTVLDNVKIGDKVYSLAIIGNAKLGAGESVDTLKSVWFGTNTTSADIAKVGETYDILVLSQAVQVEGFENDADAAFDAAFGEVNEGNVQSWFAAAAK